MTNVTLPPQLVMLRQSQELAKVFLVGFVQPRVSSVAVKPTKANRVLPPPSTHQPQGNIVTTKYKYAAVLTAVVVLAALPSVAQVKIVSFDRSSRLAWTNPIEPGLPDMFFDTAPIYRVESAGSPIGPWSAVTNTSQTVITNLPPTDQGQTFFRVVWTNGQVWSYRGYEGDTLIVTGKLYLKFSDFGYVDGGSWSLSRVGSPGNSRHRFGAGPLDSAFDANGKVYLSPYCCDNTFWLDEPNRLSNTWTGAWHYAGFGGVEPGGTFTAEKIIDGE